MNEYKSMYDKILTLIKDDDLFNIVHNGIPVHIINYIQNKYNSELAKKAGGRYSKDNGHRLKCHYCNNDVFIPIIMTDILYYHYKCTCCNAIHIFNNKLVMECE